MLKSIEKIIKEWKQEAGVKGIIQIGRHPYKTLKICTDRPGPMIGLHGSLVDKYLKKLQEVEPTILEIEFIETDYWYIK